MKSSDNYIRSVKHIRVHFDIVLLKVPIFSSVAVFFPFPIAIRTPLFAILFYINIFCQTSFKESSLDKTISVIRSVKPI